MLKKERKSISAEFFLPAAQVSLSAPDSVQAKKYRTQKRTFVLFQYLQTVETVL